MYITAPKEMEMPDYSLLKVVRPLYGIPESSLHWRLTYLDHHVSRLGMIRSRTDPCVLKKVTEGVKEGIVILQVDDSFSIGTE